MDDAVYTSLHDVAQALVVEAVAVQKRFDETFAEELKQFKVLLAAHRGALVPGSPAEAVARTLMPQQQRLRSFDVSLQVRLQAQRTRSVALQVLNAGFVARYGVRTDEASTLAFRVEAVPPPDLPEEPDSSHPSSPDHA